MNYQRHYDLLMAKAKLRGLDKSQLTGYYEKHHVVPRCLGGSDEATNLVLLTAREHFVAHWLLTKFTTGSDRHKMLYALASFQMQGSIKLTSRQIEVARKANAEAASNQNRLVVIRGKHIFQDKHFRRACSERITTSNLALVLSGAHPFQTEAVKAKSGHFMRKYNSSDQSHVKTDAFRLFQSTRVSEWLRDLAVKGKHPSQSDQAKAKFVDRMLRCNTQVLTCPKCGKQGKGYGAMKRWHFDNCSVCAE